MVLIQIFEHLCIWMSCKVVLDLAIHAYTMLVLVNWIWTYFHLSLQACKKHLITFSLQNRGNNRKQPFWQHAFGTCLAFKIKCSFLVRRCNFFISVYLILLLVLIAVSVGMLSRSSSAHLPLLLQLVVVFNELFSKTLVGGYESLRPARFLSYFISHASLANENSHKKRMFSRYL